jgi:hypothetical protein
MLLLTDTSLLEEGRRWFRDLLSSMPVAWAPWALRSLNFLPLLPSLSPRPRGQRHWAGVSGGPIVDFSAVKELLGCNEEKRGMGEWGIKEKKEERRQGSDWGGEGGKEADGDERDSINNGNQQ